MVASMIIGSGVLGSKQKGMALREHHVALGWLLLARECKTGWT